MKQDRLGPLPVPSPLPPGRRLGREVLEPLAMLNGSPLALGGLAERDYGHGFNVCRCQGIMGLRRSQPCYRRGVSS